MTEERKRRGLPPLPPPDMKKFAARVRCWSCQQLGHVSKDCQKHRRPGQKGGGKGSRAGIGLVDSFHAGLVESFFAREEAEDDPWQEIEEILAAWDNRSLHERLTEDHFERLQKELQDGDDAPRSDLPEEDEESDSEM